MDVPLLTPDAKFETIGIAPSLEDGLLMISSRIRELAENIRPLFDDQAAQSLAFQPFLTLPRAVLKKG